MSDYELSCMDSFFISIFVLFQHMEDAATAEISRVQIWQWRHHSLQTQDDGVTITSHRIHELVNEEVRKNMSKGGRWLLAGQLVRALRNLSSIPCYFKILCHLHECCFIHIPTQRLEKCLQILNSTTF